ncbi:MAG: di-trans,poly-cis-decaprenylcistransferase [Oscillospiraceae bacterium]|nr:di-trans,poly-cis-decaprenylcistransferase [Oscillospiraceae bacterium]
MIIPTHVAFIMDGNGRWAQKRGLKRTEGHKKGSESLKQLIKDINRLGIKYATFYAFSTENWKRPDDEVSTLMRLFEDYIDELMASADKAGNSRIRFAGDRGRLSESLKSKMAECEEASKDNTGLCVTIAVNYGGKDELAHAAREIARLTNEGYLTLEKITPELIDSLLYTSGIPEVDLLIRTGGEQRLSNFLIWQSAYAELYFTDTLWPDFKNKHLILAIEEFSRRNRRFGGL